ncbi:hypothetical protein [Bowmanella yangjiangensis]|uniref:Uncharacterized protein n=1 Tax=Bowmanella yangjiangensis TaxID=2811230 RepID=A0ABS3CQS6_9ALTE|nr:hypothetical protein [Bowmanella yangjiangensis]
MFVLLLPLLFIVFVVTVTLCSYKLGITKTENPKLAALLGFLASFAPPLALIYLAVLLFKDDVAVV